MTDESPDLACNPYFQNGMTLDLLSWSMITLEHATRIFINPHQEARRVTQSSQGSKIEETVNRWKREYTESGSRISLRWPHTVFPPLPEGFSLPA